MSATCENVQLFKNKFLTKPNYGLWTKHIIDNKCHTFKVDNKIEVKFVFHILFAPTNHASLCRCLKAVKELIVKHY